MKKYAPVLRIVLLAGAAVLLLFAVRNIIVERHVSNITIGRLVESGGIFIFYFLLKRDEADKKQNTPE